MGASLRQRTWPGTLPTVRLTTTWYNPPGINPAVSSRVTREKTHCGEISTITDMVGRPKSFNPVTHARMKMHRTCRPVIATTSGMTCISDPYVIVQQVTAGELSTAYSPTIKNGVTTAAFQAFVNDAFFELSESVHRQIDVYNVVRDVFDLRALVKQILGLARRLKHALFLALKTLNKGHVLKNLSVGSARDLLKEVSNGYLLHQFGIKPLIGEFDRIVTKVTNIMDRLQFLRQTAGKTFPAHYSRSVSVPNSERRRNIAETQYLGAYTWWTNVTVTTTYVASAIVRNRISPKLLDEFLGMWAGWYQGLGLNRGAEFLWDLVPFSFVLDWFIHVDTWLRNNLSPDQFAGLVGISDGGCSCKTTIAADLELRHASFVGGAVLVGNVTETYYQRVPGFKIDQSVYTQWPSLTSTQQAVLAALVFQRG